MGAFLVFPVTALYFTITPGCVKADSLVPDSQLSGRFLKEGRDIPFAVRETVGKLKSVIGLGAFHTDSPAGIPFHQVLEEVSGVVDRSE